MILQRLHTIAWSLVAFLLAAGAASAQSRPGDQGMLFVSKAGQVGNLCHGFTCTPFVGSATPNETVTLMIRGPNNAPFWLFFSPTAKLCLKIPGIEYSLIMAPPVFLGAVGSLDEQDRIRACPGGLKTLSFSIPLPQGTSFSMQSIVMAQWLNGPLPTFTAAIDVQVR